MGQTPDNNASAQRKMPTEVLYRSLAVQWALLLVSLVTIAALVKAILVDNITTEWRSVRRDYGELLQEKATDEWGRQLAEDFRVELAQIVVPELDVTDRCTTCHAGIDDPRMADAPQPFAFHPGEFLQWHEVDRFGCTPCHGGQGLATDSADAHGRVPHWDAPLLTGAQAYTKCSQCHYENDLFAAAQDIFTQQAEPGPITAGELNQGVTGLETDLAQSVLRGKQLVIQNGCLGCHQYRGRGGTLGPDISYVGDKTIHDFDFTHIHSDEQKTISLWLLEHFRHPAAVSPGTLMPQYDLSDQQAEDLTNYMISLHRKGMPSDYSPMPKQRGQEPASGHQLYALFCSSCHGSDGQGSTVREDDMVKAFDAPPELMVPSLNNPDTLAVVSDDYLRYIIEHGREGTNMIGWGPEGEGRLRAEEIDRLVAFIRGWQFPDPDLASISSERGDPRVGRIVYGAHCASCHGADGMGGIGTRLNSPSLLAVASDQFLARTLIHGRANTAMPGWPQLGPQKLSDVIAFLRTWHETKSNPTRSMVLVAEARNAAMSAPGAPVSVEIGHTLYQANCVTCHGASGEGDLGPSLATSEFLTLVDDSYLYQAIVEGRPGAGMPAWRHLSDEDVASLVLYVDSWRSRPREALDSRPLPGDWDAGRILYAQVCASCHGEDAEGAIGPQLSNPQFLSQTSDAMLQKWIAHGKTGTPMLGFLRGSQGVVDLSVHQINNIVSYLRSLERRDAAQVAKYASGRPELGEVWYRTYCTGCHGDQGEGASGPSLTNNDFLQAASSGFLMATLAMGRDGTEMRPVKKGPQSILSLSSDQVNDIVAYLRRCEVEPPIEGIAHRHVIPWDLEHGRELYVSNCAGCHGINGKAEIDERGSLSAWAPELNNQHFLRAATDGFLQATIARGRSGTSMRAFGQGSQGLTDLSADDIDDIVAYIRQWSTQPNLPMTIPAERSTLQASH